MAGYYSSFLSFFVLISSNFVHRFFFVVLIILLFEFRRLDGPPWMEDVRCKWVYQALAKVLGRVIAAAAAYVLLDFRFQAGNVGALQPIDFRLIPVKDERGHGADPLCGGRILALVHIDFEENGSRIFRGKLLEMRCNSLAWSTPAPKTGTDNLRVCAIHGMHDVQHVAIECANTHQLAVKSTTTKRIPAAVNSAWK